LSELIGGVQAVLWETGTQKSKIKGKDAESPLSLISINKK
jgi:hypothetical protein